MSGSLDEHVNDLGKVMCLDERIELLVLRIDRLIEYNERRLKELLERQKSHSLFDPDSDNDTWKKKKKNEM